MRPQAQEPAQLFEVVPIRTPLPAGKRVSPFQQLDKRLLFAIRVLIPTEVARHSGMISPAIPI